jgi:hypothetical protein
MTMAKYFHEIRIFFLHPIKLKVICPKSGFKEALEEVGEEASVRGLFGRLSQKIDYSIQIKRLMNS